MVLHGIKMDLHNFTQFHYDIYTYMELSPKPYTHNIGVDIVGKSTFRKKGVYDQNYKTTQLAMNETSGEHWLLDCY